MKKDLRARFEAMFIKYSSGCWEWTGRRMKTGYGQIKIGGRKGKPYQAHRLSYELYVNKIPSGMHVLHTCDHPWCVTS